jgi:hypothetical protein
MSPVAIVIPVYKNEITAFEAISLQQCFSILGHYPIIFICPKKMESGSFYHDYSNKAQFVFLDDHHFESIISYNHLMLSVWFYKLFMDYNYILIHQLDCFVFKDELLFWVKKEYSYIGAPWFKGSSNEDSVNEFQGVGNGGFSLRKVEDCIKVLKSSKKINSLRSLVEINRNANTSFIWLRALKQYYFSYSFKTIKNNQRINEDKIFSLAAKRCKTYTIPDSKLALAFAFEMQPKKLYKWNNNQLPFGCHAWYKYDLAFFKPIIESFGYTIKKI